MVRFQWSWVTLKLDFEIDIFEITGLLYGE